MRLKNDGITIDYEDEEVIVEKAKKHLLGIFTVVDEIKYKSKEIVERLLHENLINDSTTRQMMVETLTCYLNQLVSRGEIKEFIVSEGGPIDNLIHIDLNVTPQLEVTRINIRYL